MGVRTAQILHLSTVLKILMIWTLTPFPADLSQLLTLQQTENCRVLSLHLIMLPSVLQHVTRNSVKILQCQRCSNPLNGSVRRQGATRDASPAVFCFFYQKAKNSLWDSWDAVHHCQIHVDVSEDVPYSKYSSSVLASLPLISCLPCIPVERS